MFEVYASFEFLREKVSDVGIVVDGCSSAKGFFSYKVEGRVNSDDEVSEGENRNGDDEGDDVRGSV